jgi:hypothetical protein
MCKVELCVFILDFMQNFWYRHFARLWKYFIIWTEEPGVQLSSTGVRRPCSSSQFNILINQKPQIKQGQTKQWAKQVQKDKQWGAKNTQKTKDRATRIPLKLAMNAGAT